MNFLLIKSLKTIFEHHKNDLKVAYPTGNTNALNLGQVAVEITLRLISIFEKDDNGARPVNGRHSDYYKDPHFEDLILFFEYFHGEDSHGLGASHQTGWTGLIAKLIEDIA